MGFDYEPEFEDALIKLLKNNGWSGKMLNYPTEEQLIKNWADILFNNNKGIDRLNGQPLTKGEMQQLLDKVKELRTPLAAPGLKKDMVKMNIDKDGYLNVSIENKDEKKEEKKEEHYLRREFSYSNYSQSYALPEDADQEKISAEVSDGVLKIEIPKVAKEEKKEDVKHIEVK
jgi:HSP20 family protein